MFHCKNKHLSNRQTSINVRASRVEVEQYIREINNRIEVWQRLTEWQIVNLSYYVYQKYLESHSSRDELINLLENAAIEMGQTAFAKQCVLSETAKKEVMI